MEVTVAPNSAAAVVPPAEVVDSKPPGFVQRLSDLPMQRKLMLGGGIAALFAIFVAMLMLGRDGEYRVLYSNLSDKDGGAIIAQLQQMQVPYKYTEGGGASWSPPTRCTTCA